MSGVISAIVVLLIIGAVAALILVIASKYMSVPENEMFPAIRECLPGANCGACGYAGCDGYAKALAEGEETKTNLRFRMCSVPRKYLYRIISDQSCRMLSLHLS